MVSRNLIMTALAALALGGASKPALAGPSLFQCLDGMARLGFNQVDTNWLCGNSSNSPVQGYGDRQEYVNCALDTMQYPTMHGRGDLVTTECARHPYDRSAQTGNLPYGLYCLEVADQENPAFQEADLRWLCGLSSNTPVPGAGDRLDYVSCLGNSLAIDPVIAGIGAQLTDQCNRHSDDVSGATRYIPTALYCVAELHQISPGFQTPDLLWLCGLSSNSPGLGYGENLTYTSCLIDTLSRYPSMGGQGATLISECRSEADRGTRPAPLPQPRPIPVPVPQPRPIPVPVPPIVCPDPNTTWDPNLGRCVSRTSPIPVPVPRPVPMPPAPPRPAPIPAPRPAPIPQPRPAPVPQPRPAPIPRPAPAPMPAPQPKPQPQPQPKPDPKPAPAPAPQPAPQPKPDPKPAPAPQPKPQPQPKPDPRPQPSPGQGGPGPRGPGNGGGQGGPGRH